MHAVWGYLDFGLVLLSPSQVLTLALADLPEAMRAEILQRVKAHGGQMR